MTSFTSAVDAATQVRWAAGRKDVSRTIRATVLCVRSRVVLTEPEATETKFGLSGARRSTEAQSVASISGVFGGKNSNETRMRRAPCRLGRKAEDIRRPRGSLRRAANR